MHIQTNQQILLQQQTSPNDQHSNDNSLSLPAKVNDSDSEKKQHFGTGKDDMKIENLEVDEINK